jgi:hypothetical protein
MPLVAPGITSTSLPTVVVLGEGDPTPILVAVGTTQGVSQTTQLVGSPASMTPLLFVPDIGSSRSHIGPSDSFIAKNVLSGGKVLGVSFKREDVVEESRLVALEAMDGVAKAAMGESRSVP